MKGHKYTATAVAFSPDGEWIATGGMDGSLRLWSMSPFELNAALDDDKKKRDKIHALSYSSSGVLAVACGWGGRAELWHGKEMKQALKPFTGRTTTVEWSPNGEMLAVGGTDQAEGSAAGGDEDDEIPPQTAPAIRIFKDGEPIQEFSGFANGELFTIAFSHNGKYVAAGGSTDKVLVWDVSSGKQLAAIDIDGEVARLAIADGELGVISGKGLFNVPIKADAQAGKPDDTLAAPTRAAWLDDDVVAAGGFEVVRIQPAGKASKSAEIAGRAYDITRAGDSLWILFKDELVQVALSGDVQARHSVQ